MKKSREIRGGYIVKVHKGGKHWEYYAGVDLDDSVRTTPEFYGAFRFHDYWTASRVKSMLEELKLWAIVKEIN